MSEDILARIRDRCERVAERAVHDRIDPRGLEALAAELAETLVAGSAPGPALDPAHQIVVDAPTTLAYVLTIDAINFGSGWFPHVAKRPGLSGYLTVASALRDRFECKGPWSAGELSRLTARECAATLGQDLADPWVAELMDLYARALRELGGFLGARYAGAFEGPVREASGSAASLVGILAGMPLYRDEASYTSPSSPAETWIVPFYKRAQITASDLAAAFGSSGPGAFRDLDELTLFADNLVPHVLRCAGVVVYAAQLARRIDAAENIAAGSPAEVEIRAVAVHAVEGLVDRVRERGVATSARELDTLLWNRGQRREIKARPRHRTRSTFY